MPWVRAPGSPARRRCAAGAATRRQVVAGPAEGPARRLLHSIIMDSVDGRGRAGLSVLLASLLAPLAAACATGDKTGGRDRVAGLRAAAAGDFATAEARFRRAVQPERARMIVESEISLMVLRAVAARRIRPATAQHIFLALSHRDAGRGNYAVGELDRAAALDPHYAIPHVYAGIVYFEKWRIAEALARLDRAVQLAPDLPWAYVSRGNVRYETGDLEGALADYARSIELDPRFSLAYFARGQAWFKEGDYDAAVADFNWAASLSPRAAYALRLLGEAYWMKCDLATARANFRAAQEIRGVTLYEKLEYPGWFGRSPPLDEPPLPARCAHSRHAR